MNSVVGGLGLILLLSACGAAGVGQATPSAQPAASPSQAASPAPTPTPSASPSPTAAPSPSPTPGATPPAGFTASDFSGGAVATSSVAAVRIGHHDGYDRFVIEFSGGVPAYSVTRQSSATFTRSPRGDEVTLAGSAGVRIALHSISNWIGYSGPTAFSSPGYPYLKQALQVENFEGYQQWALGVEGTPYVRVFTLSSPDRLVVDVATA